MRSKHTWIFIILLLTTFGLFSCSAKSEDTSLNLIFSEYYQSADKYEEIQPLLNDYFFCIQNAYDASDKKNLESFILSDEYEDVSEKLGEKLDDFDKLIDELIKEGKDFSEESRATLGLLLPYQKVELAISERNLCLSAGVDVSPDWFDELNECLTNAYEEYENGTGD